MTLSKGHTGKLLLLHGIVRPQLAYMAVMHLEVVTIMVKEIFNETVMIASPHFAICL